MLIEFGDYLISTSCVAAIRHGRCSLGTGYFIKFYFNRKAKIDWNCEEVFTTEEEMLKRWNELKMQLTPMKIGIDLASGDTWEWNE